MKFIVIINPIYHSLEHFGVFDSEAKAREFGRRFGEEGSDWWIKPL